MIVLKAGSKVCKTVECEECQRTIILENTDKINVDIDHVDDDLRSSDTTPVCIECPNCQNVITIDISYPTCHYFRSDCPSNKKVA